MLLAEREGRVGFAIEGRAIGGATRDGREPGGERPGLGGWLVPAAVVDPALQGGRQDAPHREVRSVPVDARHQDGEFVTADPEHLVAAPETGREEPGHADQDAVAAGVPLGIVDLAEVVEVHDRQRQPAVISDGASPLPLELLLERAMVAQTGQRIPERFRVGPVVGVLQHDTRPVQALRRLEDALRHPERESAEGQREPGDADRREHHGPAVAAGQRVDDRRSQGDRDDEHRDQRQDQPKAHDAQVRRAVEDRLLRLLGVRGRGADVVRGCSPFRGGLPVGAGYTP